MKKKRYDQEFKEQIVRECQEVGNTALVARRHGVDNQIFSNQSRVVLFSRLDFFLRTI